VTVDLDDVTRDEWIIGGLALLLVLDLLFLPWLSAPGVSLTFHGTTIAVGGQSLSGTGAPNGWLGVLAVIALIGLLADVAIDRLSPQAELPAIGGSRARTRFWLAVFAACCLGLKFILHLGSIGNLGFGFWSCALMTGALLYAVRPGRGADLASAPPHRGAARPTESSGPPVV
jgi:hypothetical protein